LGASINLYAFLVGRIRYPFSDTTPRPTMEAADIIQLYDSRLFGYRFIVGFGALFCFGIARVNLDYGSHLHPPTPGHSEPTYKTRPQNIFIHFICYCGNSGFP
jgi:hypothetical protein